MASIHDYEPLFGSWTAADDPLGAGAFGEVYEIYRQSMGITQRAAVKRISFSKALLDAEPQRYEMVKTEILSMLDMKGAANIVAIEEFTEVNWKRGQGKDILIRMELLTGLDSLLEKETFPVSEVIKLGIHMCRALVLCEGRNLIHRDIKPANIFISSFGDYKLGDFGIARTLTEGKASTYAGTPGFKAPEVYGRKYDLRADIYSLGITLYYILNGNKLPFEDDGSGESPIVRLLDGEPLPPLRGVDSWLSQIVIKACAHKREDRYSSPKEMLKALENGERGYNTSPQPIPVPVKQEAEHSMMTQNPISNPVPHTSKPAQIMYAPAADLPATMNKVILAGRLAKDPDIRYSQGAEPVCIATYTLAVNRRFKREGEPDADFIFCTSLGKQGEFIDRYIEKDTPISLSGRLRISEYTDNTGQNKWLTDVVTEEVNLIDSPVTKNKVALLGRLARDPEVRYSQGATPICIARFTLAVVRRNKIKGEQDADFVSCVAFAKLGEFMERYFKKGMQISLSGRLQVRSYIDSTGQRRWSTEILAEEADFAESRADFEARQNLATPQSIDDDSIPY